MVVDYFNLVKTIIQNLLILLHTYKKISYVERVGQAHCTFFSLLNL